MKYPRTYHLPYSPGATSDDKILKSDDCFVGEKIYISEKMDGENITVTKTGWHARSEDSRVQTYHSWLGNFVAQWQWALEDDEKIIGEYVAVKHTIEYNDLDTYFFVIGIVKNNVFLSFSETHNRIEEIEKSTGVKLHTVPLLGIYDFENNEQLKEKSTTDIILNIAKRIVFLNGEGIVVRNAKSFPYEDFSNNVAKYVRKNHVEENAKHWSHGEIKFNTLKGK